MTTNLKIRSTGRSNGATSKSTSVRNFEKRERLLPSRIEAVIRLTGALVSAVEDLALADLPNLDEGAGFYEQVRDFEISLIKMALSRSQGSQVKAAKLLKMRVTTLNTKIKSYESKSISKKYRTNPASFTRNSRRLEAEKDVQHIHKTRFVGSDLRLLNDRG